MAKNGTCELCGLHDNSYSIEVDGNVFKVCKLCYDGFIAEHGSDSATDSDINKLTEQINATPEAAGSKPQTLSPEQMEKLLTPTSEERRKLKAAIKRAAARTEQIMAADTESIARELMEVKEEIEKETRAEEKNKETLRAAEQQQQQDKPVEQPKVQRAEDKRKAAVDKMRRAANPTIDDERIKITSPEVELPKDTRLKTNFDVATEGHVGAVRFLQAFKFVIHPVAYAVFAGMITLAVATALMITMTWKEAVISLSAGIGAVVIGALLMWYLKRRLEIDKRTYLLRIRQEEILFDSMTAPCYRELKTKYPMIKALAWLLGRLSVIIATVVVIGGTAAGVIVAFLKIWWLFAPVAV
ncbi:MAG: hypothetical protein K2L88_00610, partial [Clostridiales bacterium]|nr:hypothetical protein [Clostridiales bacterium]